MGNYRTAFALFAAAVIIGAFVTALEQVDTRLISYNLTLARHDGPR
jgi:uncharacterized membrane protein YidH (DUF202 family)